LIIRGTRLFGGESNSRGSAVSPEEAENRNAQDERRSLCHDLRCYV
jgi:hypothetical protein